MFRITFSLILAVCLLGPLPSRADQLSEGKAAFDTWTVVGRRTAFQLLKPLAEKGNPDAQVMMGRLYEDGVDIDGSGNFKRDSAEALKWYQMAADQRNLDAQFHIGFLYEHSGDYAEAQKWYLKVAEQGDRRGIAELASLYARKRVGKKDGVEAEACFWQTLDLKYGGVKPGAYGDIVLSDDCKNVPNRAEISSRISEWEKVHPVEYTDAPPKP